ncbi:helix-turn-helix transcriptional regulator [Frankia sp. CNm7]|uniref:Helix-turn-helix transcriptional regulator n=1 Tax=Frankia nepalensis TaxID=1836974 RepID=A0A937RFT9_9ACTN|nr:winged helix-turn-helix transcriptional regulator [Frankia nepalensis]MBL7496611.1 helix-turn-helix transcriptional regulator [Frankia nepalensis]MBL7513354.1 helix-turn-helix transcriptional regulator [Frankia nepalensis]MBL7521613.1 helix-turn-helix transcriptional regulator [Frankia nepalensis]MBL7626619.1 helix-turn-helix transcriptional regulator [Frankia nepalensis]
MSRSAPRSAPEGRAVAGADLPLAMLLDLLGRRHSLAIFWSLRATPRSFRALEAGLDAPTAQLTQRARELREAGLIEVDEAGDYRLTSHGRRLQGLLEPLSDWAGEWAGLTARQRTPRGSATRARDEP